jgi:hypothetical protein
LDTVGLDPKYEKVTPKDSGSACIKYTGNTLPEIAAALTKILGYSDSQQKEYFDKLQEERFNVSSLGTKIRRTPFLR